MKGDLDACQRSLLAYLMYREKKDERQGREERFKELLVANFPERADLILKGFQDDAELAAPLTDDELDFEPGYNAAEIEAAHDIFAKLFEQGGAVIPYD